jgi:hypothetical protein
MLFCCGTHTQLAPLLTLSINRTVAAACKESIGTGRRMQASKADKHPPAHATGDAALADSKYQPCMQGSGDAAYLLCMLCCLNVHADCLGTIRTCKECMHAEGMGGDIFACVRSLACRGQMTLLACFAC